MMFQVEITEPAHLAGITAARQAFNDALPEGSEAIASDEAYVQFVMIKAAESYSVQYNATI